MLKISCISGCPNCKPTKNTHLIKRRQYTNQWDKYCYFYPAQYTKSDQTLNRTIPLIDVPCHGCTLCCKNDVVRLRADEAKLGKWNMEPHPYIPNQFMLAHKINGDCYYLNSDGCSIHYDKPRQCQSMDCRTLANRFTFEQARQNPYIPLRVWRKGKKLLTQ